MQFRLDTSDFDKKFKELAEKEMPELQEKGMGRAMLSLLGDCVMQVPTVPVKEGWLRGSGSIFVQGKFVGDSTGFGKARFATNESGETKELGNHKLVGLIGFNAPYAARLHEGIDFKFSEPSSGPKFLESKLISNGKAYMREVADTIKEGGK